MIVVLSPSHPGVDMRHPIRTLLAGLLLASSSAAAQPVAVDYSISGSAGNWLLNFTLRNAFGSSDHGLYFFGVSAGSSTITNSPSNWSPFMAWTVAAGSGRRYASSWMTDPSTGLLPGQALTGFTIRTFDMDMPTTVRWFAYGFSNSGASYEGGDNFNGSTYNPGVEGSSTGTVAQVNLQSTGPTAEDPAPEDPLPPQDETPYPPQTWTPEEETPPWTEPETPPPEVISNDLPSTVTPEPSTYVLMLSGLGAIGYVSRRRRATA